jgi:D-glycero-D-manno-heptose 1,7-bisphosphate phosphatase
VKRAVFLDRDGVINRPIVRDGKPYPPESVAELEILAGVNDALASLRSAGFLNIVVTNQPDVATGKQKVEIIEAMHRRLRLDLALDDIRVCFHADADGCDCRKPKPGMLLQAAREFGIDLGQSFMVGDRWLDVAAGRASGCANFFIDYGYLEKRPEPPYIAVKSLAEASRRILAESVMRNRDLSRR